MSPTQLESSAREFPCDLCGGTKFDLVCDHDRRNQELMTVICRSCGLVSHERIPDEDELREYYSEFYRSDYHGEYHPSPHRVLRACHVGQALCERTKDYLRDDDQVLEVGAGIGCTVRSFQEAGFSASGIEPGRAFCNYAINEVGVHVAPQWLDELKPSEAYDFILLVHVIEHLRLPSVALCHLRKLLRPGGRLYVECPNVGEPHAAPGKLFHYAHIYNFTPDTLQMMCEANGFQLVKAFSSGDNRSIHMLFEKAENGSLQLLPESYQRTIKGIFRHNWFTYHMRPNYLVTRLRRAAGFLFDHWMPATRVRRILRRTPESKLSHTATKRAA